MVQLVVTVLFVITAAAICMVANVASARANARLQRLAERGSKPTSVSPPRNTTHCLNTREDVARFVDEVRNPGNDLQWIMITRLDSCGVFYVSCATSESSEPALQAYLSRRLLTSLTPQELQFWENELRQVDRRNKDANARGWLSGEYDAPSHGGDDNESPSWARRVWGIDQPFRKSRDDEYENVCRRSDLMGGCP